MIGKAYLYIDLPGYALTRPFLRPGLSAAKQELQALLRVKDSFSLDEMPIVRQKLAAQLRANDNFHGTKLACDMTKVANSVMRSQQPFFNCDCTLCCRNFKLNYTMLQEFQV